MPLVWWNRKASTGLVVKSIGKCVLAVSYWETNSQAWGLDYDNMQPYICRKYPEHQNAETAIAILQGIVTRFP